jgi:hypothetical protein
VVIPALRDYLRLAELDRRAQEITADSATLEDWSSIRERLQRELRSK